MTTEEILQRIIDLVLTGGRRTTAANVREILSDIANSYVNINDAVFPKKVSDSTTIGLLVDPSNWNLDTQQYTGVAITGQNEGDWYDDGRYRYLFRTSTTISRAFYLV